MNADCIECGAELQDHGKTWWCVVCQETKEVGR